MIPFRENIKFTNKGICFCDKNGNILSLNEAFKKAISRFYNYFLDFRLFLIHIVSFHIPFHIIRKFIFKTAGVKIGKGSTIHMGCRFFEPKGVKIGEDTIIGNNALLDGRSSLHIGNHVDIASDVMIYNSEHDINDPEFKAISNKVKIGDYCFIGPRSIILPGVSIGKGAVVCAGAVVTKDVRENTIVAGIPAKKIGVRKLNNYSYILGRSKLFI